MEVYNRNKLWELVKEFYNLVGLKVCLYDSNGDEILFYPEKLSPFCALLREDDEMNRRCIECDRKAFAECKKSRKQYFYTCHAGLLEYMSPILYSDKVIGYLVLGQIKTETHSDFEKISDRLPADKHDGLRKCFDSLSVIELNKLKSAMKILDACTGYEYLKGLMSISDKKIDSQITEFIDENIGGDLSVSRICSCFRLSHSEIYSIFKGYFNSTPAEYVKSRRLAKACDLLEKTDNSVNKIGVECGFQDYNYFSKVFKRALGMSPRDYRKSVSR